MNVAPAPLARAAYFGLALSLLSAVASAQLQIPAGSPLQSVLPPAGGIADAGEPWSVVQNPAAMAPLRGYLFGLRHRADAGHRLHWARLGPLSFAAAALLSKLAVGGALEILRPPVSGPAAVTGKLSLALSYRLRPGWRSAWAMRMALPVVGQPQRQRHRAAWCPPDRQSLRRAGLCRQRSHRTACPQQPARNQRRAAERSYELRRYSALSATTALSSPLACGSASRRAPCGRGRVQGSSTAGLACRWKAAWSSTPRRSRRAPARCHA